MKKILTLIMCFGFVMSISGGPAKAMLKSSPIDDQGPTKPPPKKNKKN